MRNLRFNWLRVFVSLIICVPCFCSAQGNDVEINAKYHPTSRYVPPMDSSSRIGSSRQVEFTLSSHISLYKKIDTTTGKVKLLNGAFFGKKTPFSNSGYNKQILPDDLYSISAGISYYASINKTWAYTLFLNSALNTDFISVDYNDLFLTGGVQFIRQFSPRFRLGFGAIIHNNLGKPMFWPALSVYWNFGRRFNVDIRVPDEGNGLAYTIGVGYQYNDHFKLGFAFKPYTISYDVERKNEINNRLMNYWQLPFELSGTYTRGHFGYTATIGFTALRSFAYAEKDIKNMFTKYPYHSLSTNLIFGAGIKYRF
ncbi:DUF6268 family outer membrane beta-barrel protein [Xanthocytophaga flava]|uniref:DUF6268 family outer membrane beta-barrel protein n=1 Tax=Xanthocytophaga flava TaxID=3048013 RepID=UPI0028D1F669|nr:DUF6268 family outer membrane beta-barrel protein [Xanthocytophaga flavus]MDJ1469260.1 DUF6268 family outer membrane beta-barrel protein [Xanthocytophaga flavus]